MYIIAVCEHIAEVLVKISNHNIVILIYIRGDKSIINFQVDSQDISRPLTNVRKTQAATSSKNLSTHAARIT